MAAALDDEVGHYPVEQGVGVEALAHVAQEIGHREGRPVRIQLDHEGAHVRRDAHLRIGGVRVVRARRGLHEDEARAGGHQGEGESQCQGPVPGAHLFSVA